MHDVLVGGAKKGNRVGDDDDESDWGGAVDEDTYCATKVGIAVRTVTDDAHSSGLAMFMSCLASTLNGHSWFELEESTVFRQRCSTSWVSGL